MDAMYLAITPWKVTSARGKARKLADELNLMTADGTHPATVEYVNKLLDLAAEFQEEKSPTMVYEALRRASLAISRLSMNNRRAFVPRMIQFVQWLGPGRPSQADLFKSVLPVLGTLEPPASLDTAKVLSQLRESYSRFGSGDVQTAEPISATAVCLYDHFAPDSVEAGKEHLQLGLIYKRLGKYQHSAQQLDIASKFANDGCLPDEYGKQIISAQIEVYSQLHDYEKCKKALAAEESMLASLEDYEDSISRLIRTANYERAIEYASAISPQLDWTQNSHSRAHTSAQIENWCQELYDAGASSEINQLVSRCLAAAKKAGKERTVGYAILCTTVSRRFLTLCQYKLAARYAQLALDTRNSEAIGLLLYKTHIVKQFQINGHAKVANRLFAELAKVAANQDTTLTTTTETRTLKHTSEQGSLFPIRKLLDLEKPGAKIEALIDEIDSASMRAAPRDIELIQKLLKLACELSANKQPATARRIVAITNEIFPTLPPAERCDAANAILETAARMPGVPRRTGCILMDFGVETRVTNVIAVIESKDCLNTLATARLLTCVRANYLDQSNLTEAVSKAAVHLYDQFAPNSAEAALEHLALGKTYMHRHSNSSNYDLAEDELTKSLTLANAGIVSDAEKAQIVVALIDLFEWSHQGDKLVALLSSEKEWIQEKKNVDTAALAVHALIHCGKYAGAIALARKIIPALSWEPAAIASFAPFNKSHSDCAEIDNWAGALQQMCQIDQMDKLYASCLKLTPGTDRQHDFARRRLCLTAYRRFEKLHKTAIADRYAEWSCQFLDPAAPDDFLKLAAEYKNQGRFEKARKILSIVIAAQPEREKPACKLLLASLYLDENSQTAALAQYNEVLEAVASRVELPTMRDYLMQSQRRIISKGIYYEAVDRLQAYVGCGSDMLIGRALEQHALDDDESEAALLMCKARLDFYERHGQHASAQIRRRYVELSHHVGQSVPSQ